MFHHPKDPSDSKFTTDSKFTIRSKFATAIVKHIFFSLTEAPLPDPTPTPPNTPKRTRNGPKTDPKRSQTEPNGAETEPNGAEMDRNQAFRGGTGGGFVGVGGVGGCKGKRISLRILGILTPNNGKKHGSPRSSSLPQDAPAMSCLDSRSQHFLSETGQDPTSHKASGPRKNSPMPPKFFCRLAKSTSGAELPWKLKPGFISGFSRGNF